MTQIDLDFSQCRLFQLEPRRSTGQASCGCGITRAQAGSSDSKAKLFDTSIPHWALSKRGSQAWQWIHTDIGGQVASDFIRLALYCKNILHKKVGAKCLSEKIRWDYEVSKPVDEEYKINNNYTSYLARFAMLRVVDLRGYFDLREVK